MPCVSSPTYLHAYVNERLLVYCINMLNIYNSLGAYYSPKFVDALEACESH